MVRKEIVNKSNNLSTEQHQMEVKAGDVVALHGSWVDLMIVERTEGQVVYFTSGDYADVSRVRPAEPEEVEVGCKIF